MRNLGKTGTTEPEFNRVLRPAGWPVPQGYADGISARGRIVVTGGVVGWNARQELAKGFVEQARLALQNIVAIIDAGGA